MKQRILEFLRTENKSSAQIAEEIGVQPSGISHILSGRNNPSLDFVLKMLEKYQFISTDWLLFGKGSMYKDQKIQTLFDDDTPLNHGADMKMIINESKQPEQRLGDEDRKVMQSDSHDLPVKSANPIQRIVWFYADNSFEEYLPRK